MAVFLHICLTIHKTNGMKSISENIYLNISHIYLSYTFGKINMNLKKKIYINSVVKKITLSL